MTRIGFLADDKSRNGFLLLIVASIAHLTYGYDDVEKKCPNGQKIHSFKRDSIDNENGRLTFECGDMKPSPNDIKSPKCEQAKPFACNGQPTGCPSGTWLAGITAYQLDTSGSPDLLVPTCCSSENVNIDQCSERRLNSVNSKIDSSLGDNEIYQGFTCLPLVKSNRQKGENGKQLSDILYKASICKYSVKSEPTTPAPTTTTQSTSPSKIQADNSNNGAGGNNGGGGAGSGRIVLPTRGPRKL